MSELTTDFDQTDLDSLAIETDEWSLNADQMTFMMQNNNLIMQAFAQDDVECLRKLEASDDFKALFGTMSFDEAYDRYECMLED